MIHTYLFNHPELVTESQFQQSLAHVSLQRRAKALSFRFLIDRVLSVQAYLLLCRGLREVYGIYDLPEFTFVGHDKPVIVGHPEIFFNLSHCRRGIMCAISDRPVGVDIEEIETTLDTHLIDYCFNGTERQDILSAPDPCIRFTRWWTRKEAYLKLTGEGLTDTLPSLFSPALLQQIRFDSYECPEQGYVYTIAQFTDHPSDQKPIVSIV